MRGSEGSELASVSPPWDFAEFRDGVYFEDLEVPVDMAVIPPRGIKHGFAGLMDAYNGQRVLPVPSARHRGRRIRAGLSVRARAGAVWASDCEFQGLQWMLVDMDIKLEMRATCYGRRQRAPPRIVPNATMAARAKIFASESAIEVTNDALNSGATGYSRNQPMERVRDARMFAIAGGTAQILRTVVASRLLGRKLPQAGNGYVNSKPAREMPIAAE